ncbi:MAG: universal stress protein [Chloroflexi bacterium]|nr:universal stress protein [Chloroflexota bacterium]
MYQKMLVPLDGSELAEVVFPYAKELAARLDLEVVLLHIANPILREFAPMSAAYIEHSAETVRRQARAVQRKLGVQPWSKPLRIRGELVSGYPAEEILRYAEENHIDLILIATHGRSGVKRWVLGSVADKILRASNVPVFLVRAGMADETPYDKWSKRTIVVPLDGSDLAEAVLPHVEALARQRTMVPLDVVLLRICEPMAMPSYYAPELSGVPLNWGEYMQQEAARCKKEANEYLVGVEKRLRDKGFSVSSEVLMGKAAEEIVKYVSKNPFSLIVMATHGRSGLSRLVYGSVAENVLLRVNSPIVLVSPR